MSDVAIRIDDLGKRYRIGALQKGRHDTLRDELSDLFRSGIRRLSGKKDGSQNRSADADTSTDSLIWAVRNVSFEVQYGEVLGIIGNNGAGKTTLLKLLSRITEPTEGRAEIFGRISALLEVGTGIHPELTGRENIYLNGTILGMRRVEIGKKFDEIVEFAGIGKFIDTPVKRYSTGMKMRLAFAVAAHLEPEILLVDEVLAVGDAGFQKKCIGKMQEVTRQGRTVLFVSHNMGAVRSLCDRVVLLNQGKVVRSGSPDEMIVHYLEGESRIMRRRATFPINPSIPMQVLEVRIVSPGKTDEDLLDIGDPIALEIKYIVKEDIAGAIVSFLVHKNGVHVFGSFDIDLDEDVFEWRKAGVYHVRIEFPRRLLTAGRYSVWFSTGRSPMSGSNGAFELHREAIWFELEELSEDTTHRSYGLQRNTMNIMPLPWEVVNREPVSLVDAYPV